MEADEKEIVIIELQFDSIAEYYHRMLFGVSKAITPDFDGFNPIEKNNNLIISDIYFWVKM